MRLQLTVTHRGDSAPGTHGLSVVDLEVDAPTGSTAGELVVALAGHLGLQVPRDEALTVAVGGVVVDPDALVGLPPLLDGAALTLLPRKPLPDSSIRSCVPRRSPVVLAVTHGPDCGRVIDLRPGLHTIGRSEDSEICIDDAHLSRRHTEVCVDADGVSVRDLGSTNGTYVDRTRVGGEPVAVTTASVIHLGDTMVALRRAGSIPAATTATGEGTLAVNRRPRVLEPHPPVGITLPTAPQQPRRTRVPWLAVLLPVPVAAVLAVVVGPTMLAFALMGPVLMVGTALGDRWGARRTYAADLLAHHDALRTANERIEAACRDEIRELTRSFPGPATVLGIAAGPTERLWERRRADDDAFVVTIGRCRQDASLRLLRQDASSSAAGQPQLHDAPCTVSLKEVGVLGLSGERTAVAASARALVGQLVTMHSPADLSVVCLLRAEELRHEWAWLSRVPHCRSAFHAMTGTAVLNPDEAAVHTTVAALATTIRDRLAHHGGTPWSGPTTLVVVDGARAFRAVPGLATVLANGPRVGVVTLTLGADRRELPHEAGAVLDLGRRGFPTLSLPGHRHDHLVVDGVEVGWAERLSRSLAPLRDATPSEGPAALPAAVGLLACGSPVDSAPTDTGTGVLTGDSLAAAWLHRPHSTSVPLGVCGAGTFCVDLASDGPHVLVGGTTGAGKSELLRTLVASLALHNTPQHLSFVLVDYKGGAAFRDCADLPHVAGVVTDLDDHLAARALTSLTAELTRRERLLRDAGSTDFVSYQARSASKGAPLARLVVVVDEFRALAEELPAFVDGLVHLAALGRSLGIHLVLATQRPAGVVTADIKANVNLRIALRMRDRVDSEDVVDSPAAAALDPSTPGRAQARVGGSSLVEFQSAHVGAMLVEPNTTLHPRPAVGSRPAALLAGRQHGRAAHRAGQHRRSGAPCHDHRPPRACTRSVVATAASTGAPCLARRASGHLHGAPRSRGRPGAATSRAPGLRPARTRPLGCRGQSRQRAHDRPAHRRSGAVPQARPRVAARVCRQRRGFGGPRGTAPGGGRDRLDGHPSGRAVREPAVGRGGRTACCPRAARWHDAGRLVAQRRQGQRSPADPPARRRLGPGRRSPRRPRARVPRRPVARPAARGRVGRPDGRPGRRPLAAAGTCRRCRGQPCGAAPGRPHRCRPAGAGAPPARGAAGPGARPDDAGPPGPARPAPRPAVTTLRRLVGPSPLVPRPVTRRRGTGTAAGRRAAAGGGRGRPRPVLERRRHPRARDRRRQLRGARSRAGPRRSTLAGHRCERRRRLDHPAAGRPDPGRSRSTRGGRGAA